MPRRCMRLGVSMVNSGSLSLIIPTYDRPHFLTQLLSYLRSQNFSHPIVVADSSPHTGAQANQNIVDEMAGQLSIRYMGFDSNVEFTKKMSEVLSTVESEYSVACADDDFIVPRAIEESVGFLEANPDYVVAHGCYLHLYSFEVKAATKTPVVALRRPEPDTPRTRLWVFNQYPLTVESNDPSKRFEEYMRSEAGTLYAVHRTANHLRNMQLALASGKYGFFIDLLTSCLDSIQGRMKTFNLLHVARPYHDPDYRYARALRLDLPDLVVLDDYSEQYSRFSDCLAHELTKVGGVSIESAKQTINRSFLWFMANHLHYAVCQKQMLDRSSKLTRVLHASARLAAVDRRLFMMMKSPREFALTAYVLGDKLKLTPLDSFLRRFHFFDDLRPILGSLGDNSVSCEPRGSEPI
jgi:glycosyltransferase domain-containing protein